MRKLMFKLIAVGLLTCSAAFGGSFTSDFSNPNQTGIAFNGGPDTAGNPYPTITNGVLLITYNEGSLTGSAILDDLDGGSAIDSFVAKFQLQLGPGTGTPADGFSFAFGPDVSGTFGEQGPGSMSAGITVAFDTYQNTGDTIGIIVKEAGNPLVTVPVPTAQLVDGAMHDVYVQVKRNGTLNVVWKSQTICTNLILANWSSLTGFFGFGGRTGGSTELCQIDNLNITTTAAAANPVKPAVTLQPADASVAEGAAATFYVDADASAPVTVQWAKNGTDIPNATNYSLTLPQVSFNDNGAKITCKFTNGAGSATSQAATLTVSKDTTAPTLVSAVSTEFLNSLVVTFSEPVSKSSAETTGNYTIQGLNIQSAVQDANNTRRVTLNTIAMTQGTVYTLKVSNIQDQAATPNTIAPNSTLTFQAYVLLNGICKAEFFNDIGGATAVADLTNSASYIVGTPSLIHYFSGFDVAESYLNGNVDNYGVRVTGWIIPPSSGSWDFFIRSDDSSAFFLSTDDTPAHLTTDPICYEDGCCKAFLEPGVVQTTQSPISLTGGKRYYFMALMKEGGGGDFVQVAMRKSDDTTAAANLKPVSGTSLQSAADPAGSTINIDQQPQNVTAVDGKTATFTIKTTASSALGSTVIYQWDRNGTAISGATASAYTLPVTTADNGAKFDCVVSVPGKALTSDQVTLTVITDTTPPVAKSASAVKNQAGTFDVGIAFDEPLDAAKATTSGNYTIAGGTVTAANYFTNSPSVVLTVSGLTAGNKYTVAIKNVTDIKNNALSTNLDFVVTKLTWGTVGAEELPTTSTVGFVGGFPNGYGVVAIDTNSFDIYSDGVGEWGTFDETTFVYEQVTGDFDKKLRVEYQDLSSQWARAGLIMRENLSNFGQDRDTQGTTAGRYQKIHVNPVGPTLTGPGTAGNNAWEGNRRLDVGSQSTSALTANNSNPLYPNAWVRLQRIGQKFNIFRSDDGKAWVWMGWTVWPDEGDPNPTPMADTVYVGPEYTPENGNITLEADRGRFMAKIRNYGDTWGPVPTVAKRDYSIGMNFGADLVAGGISSSLAASDVAGVPGIKQKNWNNLDGATGTKSALVADQNGAAVSTTAQVTWSSPNLWSTMGNGETNNMWKGADATLMHAYLDTGDATTTTVTIDNLTPSLTSGGYDLYVYAVGGVGTRGGAYRVLDSAGNVLKDYVYNGGPWYAPDFYPAADNSSLDNPSAGNYIVFRGLNAPSVKIEATTANGHGFYARGVGGPRAPINAIQLVSPASSAIPNQPKISIKQTGTTVTITYTGTLQSADSIKGSWADVNGATSPYVITPNSPQKYYRAKQ